MVNPERGKQSNVKCSPFVDILNTVSLFRMGIMVNIMILKGHVCSIDLCRKRI